MRYRQAALLGLLFAQPLAAQSQPAAAPAIAPVAVAALPIAPAVQTPAVLRVGTELPLRLLQELTTEGKQLRVGNRFRMETSEPLLVNGVTVIPIGTPAVGEITDVRNKGMWGKSGKFTARLLYLTVNGRQIRLSGGFDDKGVAGGIAAVAVSAIVFAPAGFFMTGTSARVPAGTVVKGFIDEDVPLALPAGPPPVLAVEPAGPSPEPAVEPAPDGAAAADAPEIAFQNPSHRRPPAAR